MAGDNGNEDLRIGVYVCHCGSNIAGVVDTAVIAEFASKLPGVVRALDPPYACADSGQSIIKEKDRLVIFTLRKVIPQLEKLLTVKLDYF